MKPEFGPGIYEQVWEAMRTSADNIDACQSMRVELRAALTALLAVLFFCLSVQHKCKFFLRNSYKPLICLLKQQDTHTIFHYKLKNTVFLGSVRCFQVEFSSSDMNQHDSTGIIIISYKLSL